VFAAAAEPPAPGREAGRPGGGAGDENGMLAEATNVVLAAADGARRKYAAEVEALKVVPRSRRAGRQPAVSCAAQLGLRQEAGVWVARGGADARAARGPGATHAGAPRAQAEAEAWARKREALASEGGAAARAAADARAAAQAARAELAAVAADLHAAHGSLASLDRPAPALGLG